MRLIFLKVLPQSTICVISTEFLQLVWGGLCYLRKVLHDGNVAVGHCPQISRLYMHGLLSYNIFKTSVTINNKTMQ